jgi:hypothetical protein
MSLNSLVATRQRGMLADREPGEDAYSQQLTPGPAMSVTASDWKSNSGYL